MTTGLLLYRLRCTYVDARLKIVHTSSYLILAIDRQNIVVLQQSYCHWLNDNRSTVIDSMTTGLLSLTWWQQVCSPCLSKFFAIKGTYYINKGGNPMNSERRKYRCLNVYFVSISCRLLVGTNDLVFLQDDLGLVFLHKFLVRDKVIV